MTHRAIPIGDLQGRETETRHSLLSAYLHVVCQDGGAAEFLEAYDEAVAGELTNR